MTLFMELASNITLPKSINRVLDLAKSYLAPSAIILFGSRARGDGSVMSDYDLAFVFDKKLHNSWLRFVATVEDEPICLYPIDLINWNEASADFRKQILKEGMFLYGDFNSIRELH